MNSESDSLACFEFLSAVLNNFGFVLPSTENLWSKMNQKQKLAINAEMKEIIKALESKLESFLEYLKLKSIVDDNEIRRVKMYDYMVSRISEILLVIEKKDSGWDALIEFLDTNGEEILARHLRKKGGASPAGKHFVF